MDEAVHLHYVRRLGQSSVPSVVNVLVLMSLLPRRNVILHDFDGNVIAGETSTTTSDLAHGFQASGNMVQSLGPLFRCG